MEDYQCVTIIDPYQRAECLHWVDDAYYKETSTSLCYVLVVLFLIFFVGRLAWNAVFSKIWNKITRF